MRLWNRVIHPISRYFRSRRMEMLLKHYPEIAQFRICDLGGSRHFWQESKLNIGAGQITIWNVSASETGAYDIGSEGGGRQAMGEIPVLMYDGRTLPCEDKSYDLVICNSVLEHVPPAQRDNLCREMRRVAQRVYVQTPAYEFPFEPHFVVPFLHWLPRKTGRMVARASPWAILSRPDERTFAEYFDGTQLLTRKEMASLFPDAQIETERFSGLAKSHLVFWNRASSS
jgi:methyltransferase family protein